ncbi:MAG: hypothetical protein WCB51_11285 [Candidatus Dormiibacterota bacterium]
MDWSLIVQTVTAATAVLVLIAFVIAATLWARRNHRVDAALRQLQEGNAALLEAVARQTEGATAMAAQAREDREFAAMPLLILLDEPPVGIREQPWAAVRVRNVGNGPALYFVVWMLTRGSVYRSAGAEANGFSGALHLAPGDIFEPGPLQNMLYVGEEHGYLDPGAAVVSAHPAANLMAYCGDHFGNRYRFNLRTADPPAVWERGADAPPWAGAWDPRLSAEEPRDHGSALRPSSLTEREGTRLATALRDALAALEDADPGADVRLTGRPSRREVQ